MSRADEDTLQTVRLVLAEAMERGVDAAEALDRAHLLQFPLQQVEVRRQVLRDIADTLDEIQCKQIGVVLSERLATSPLEMKRQIVAWIKETAKP